ncbi:MAG: HAMP domain-containing sensor histidine kinase, partial [Eubacteriales bacterium]|nr:HAMP domain-containing sensor histidine kinase [Eubacteriales bacterium]
MQERIRKVLDRLTFLKSLRVIFFIIIFLVGVVPCVLLQNGILRDYEQRAVEVRVEQVKGQLRSLANHLISSNYLVNQESGQVDAELSEFSTLYDGRLLIIDSTLNVVKDTYGLSENKTIVSQDVIMSLTSGDRSGLQNYDAEYGFIEVVIPIIETRSLEGLDSAVYGQETLAADKSQSGAIRGVLLASTSTEYIQRTKDILRRKAFLLQTIMLIVVFVASVLISGFLVRPFEVLSRDIREVKEGYSNEPIRAPQYLETIHIADAFNNVLGRMNALDQSRQEFVANVSHELKTPMTSMKVLAASLLSEENVDPAVYREFLEDIDGEIDRENKIISDLLALVREDRTDIELDVALTDINALAKAVMKRLGPLAQERDIALTLVSRGDVFAEVDATRISLVLTNLVENAIKYNHEQGEVTVTLDADHQYFQFTVSDTGIGIPEEDQGRIFERFFRVDKSRSREIGGTGLGLSITKSAVLRHHGTISVSSREGEGTTFTVRIPLHYSTQPMELRVGHQRRQIIRLLRGHKNNPARKEYMEKTIRVSRRKGRKGNAQPVPDPDST